MSEDHDEELVYDHIPMELMGDIEPHVSRNAITMAGLQVSGSEFSSEIGLEEAPEYVNQLDQDKSSILSYSRTPPASYVSERSWTCPTPKRLEKSGEKCNPEMYIKKKHRWKIESWCTTLPFRIHYFINRKLSAFSNWMQPPDLYDPDIGSGEPQWPFLELKVTFDPSAELAVLYYFQALSAQKRLGVEVEFDKIQQYLEDGADINARDEMGKTVLHAACREERLDVIKFLVEKGAAVNTMDKHGRTPLHMAAAMDNHSVIGYLCKSKADYGAITHGDIQTPLHYAAKNDAHFSCINLVDNGANIEAKDYRGRTPLLLASELDRSVAASVLLDCGASAKILDYTGYHPVCAMIKNMPDVAVKGLNRFYRFNKTSRQEFFYLNCLEPSLISGEDLAFPSPSVLEEVVKTGNQELIKHPVVREMIKTKWNQFGIFGCIYDLLFYLFTLIIWSLNVMLRTYNAEKYTNEFVTSDAIAIIASLLFLLQAFEEINETLEGYRSHKKWKEWKLGQIRSDLQFVLPENFEEKIYLEDMEDEVQQTKSPYWSDSWNVYDWTNLTLLFFTYTMYWVNRYLDHESSMAQTLAVWKSMFITVNLSFSWIKLFKYLKVFESMGPFVVIIANTFGDIFKIAFVYFILYVPASCVFYQFFGSSHVEEYSNSIMAVFFTVFRMIVVDDYYYEDILAWGKLTGIPESWIHFLISYWLLMSAIVLLNLFIALMSDTFQRIYDKAVEVAALERAETIVALEKQLPSERRDQFLNYIKRNFAPKISYIEIDPDTDMDDGKTSVRDVTKTMIEQVKKLSSETVEKHDDEKLDTLTEFQEIFASQEVTLRQALHKLEEMQIE